LQQVTEANTNQRRRKMNKGQQLPVGHGTGSRYERGLQKAEDYIEALPEHPTEAQKKAYADHVERWNRPQERVQKGELAGSDYRVKIIYENNGALVQLPAGK
jgi:hypothetical protein